MAQTVYIRGLPRSGTNLLEYILKENFNVYVQSASKHGIIPIPDNKELRLAYITKHPVDWLVSIYAYGWGNENLFISESEWPDFVDQPIVMLTGPRGMWFPSPVHVWNCYIHHYNTWRNAIHIQLERFKLDTLVKLQKAWSLEARRSPLILTPYSMNTNATPTGQRYRKRRRDGVTSEIANKIMKQVNMELFERMGYKNAEA
jgi:hypothetical protein